jgi:pimeloyl-ACP methyl ester carboxylesterase
LFCTPQTRRNKPLPKVFAQAKSFTLRVGKQELAAWSWERRSASGQGPTVILHHGWSGRAADLAAFVEPLLTRGFRVLAYDTAAHGQSSGKISAAPIMAELLLQVAQRENNVHAVIAHSAGAAATMIALQRGLKLKRAALLAPPSDLTSFMHTFAQHLGLRASVRSGMRVWAEQRFHLTWEQANVENWLADVEVPLMVLHDVDDKVVPFAEVKRIKRSAAHLTVLEQHGLGHFRICRAPQVVEAAVDFVAVDAEV